MRTVLVGTGSIGGTVAVMLKEHGYDIDVVAHGEEKAKVIRERGFILEGALGSYTTKMNAYPDVDSLEGEYDVCFIATKYQQMPDVARKMLPHLKEDSLVISLQNGICTDMLSDVVGEKRTVSCMIGFGATLVEANRVYVTSNGEFYVGMPNGYHPKQLDELANMLSAALPTQVSEDIISRLYSKVIINSCINSLAGISGKTLGQTLDEKKARKTFLSICREAMTLAKAMGLNVPKYGKLLDYNMFMMADSKAFDSVCGTVIYLVGKLKYKNVKPSTLQSLEKGHKTEIDIMNGYIAAKGKEYNVPTPVNDKLTRMIKEIENGERKICVENIYEL